MILRRLLFGLCPLGAALASTAFGQVNDPVKARLDNSPRHHEWVDVKSGDRTVRSFVVYPEVSEKATSVVIIHEIFGLSDWIRSVADAVAEAGYIAIAPDLLSGTGPDGGGTDSYPSGDAVIQGVFKLPADQVTADLDAAYDYVKGLDAANGKVAVMGFCWGGGKSFAYVAHKSELAAALVFYGSAPGEEDMKTITAPVYGFYGENDARITTGVPAATEKMKELGKKYEPVTYAGAGHGFLRAGVQPDASEADRKAHDEAWERVKKILAGVE